MMNLRPTSAHTASPHARRVRPAGARAIALRADAARRSAAWWLLLATAAGLATTAALRLAGTLP